MSRPSRGRADPLVDERPGHDPGEGGLAGRAARLAEPPAVGEHHGVTDVGREPERDEDDAEREEVEESRHGRVIDVEGAVSAAAAPPGFGPAASSGPRPRAA